MSCDPRTAPQTAKKPLVFDESLDKVTLSLGRLGDSQTANLKLS